MNFHAKRIVSTLCALAMLAAMIPSAALADDTVTAPASSAIAVETPAPDVQEEPDVSIDAGNTDPSRRNPLAKFLPQLRQKRPKKNRSRSRVKPPKKPPQRFLKKHPPLPLPKNPRRDRKIYLLMAPS